MSTEMLQRFCYFPNIPDEKTIFSHKGAITFELIAKIATKIPHLFQDKPKLTYKLYSIMIELAQNLLYYSEEFNHHGACDKVGSILLSEAEMYYSIATGNLIKTESLSLMIEKSNYINSLDTQELRNYKRTVRNESESHKGGIGLIQTSILSENPLYIDGFQINENYSFLIICAKIEK